MNRNCFKFQMFPTIISVLFIFLIGCEKEDLNEEEVSPLKYLKVGVFSEDVSSPNGYAYLFYVEEYADKMDNMKPANYVTNYTPYMFYSVNGKNQFMYPVSEYGTKKAGQLLTYNDRRYSLQSFNWSELSTTYGTPKPGGKYVLFVMLQDDVYALAYKELTLTKSSIIEVHFPKIDKSAESIFGWVDANFIIKDYHDGPL